MRRLRTGSAIICASSRRIMKRACASRTFWKRSSRIRRGGAAVPRDPKCQTSRQPEGTDECDQLADRPVSQDGPDRPIEGGVGALRRALPRLTAGERRGARAQGVERDGPHQRIAALPHVKPEPNAVSTSRSPRCNRPCATASSSAIGIEAAVVLPYFWMLLYT